MKDAIVPEMTTDYWKNEFRSFGQAGGHLWGASFSRPLIQVESAFLKG